MKFAIHPDLKILKQKNLEFETDFRLIFHIWKTICSIQMERAVQNALSFIW